jgi:hypothetical protein
VNPTFKALLVWLMLLATPLQGFASVTKLVCAPLPAVAAHALFSVVHEAQVAATANARHAGADSHNGGESSAHHHPAGKCSNCASCCVGAPVLPPATITLPACLPQFVSIPFDAHHMTSFDSALPERPPRA